MEAKPAAGERIPNLHFVFVVCVHHSCIHSFIPGHNMWRLTAERERRQVHGHVVLLAAQLAAVALQVVPVAGVLRGPVHLVAAVGVGRHLGAAALQSQRTHAQSEQLRVKMRSCGRAMRTYRVSAGRTDEGDGDGRVVSFTYGGRSGGGTDRILQPQSGRKK